MNEMMISVDISPNLSALCGSDAAATVVAQAMSAAQQPSADAVAAFQSAMSSLVAENREVQAALEKVVPLSLLVPLAQVPVAETAPAQDIVAAEAKPMIAPEVKPVVAQVTPKIVREFAEVIAPLVAENREVQAALEKIVPLPLGVPAVAAEAKVAVTPAAKPVDEVEAKQVVTTESKPVVAQVTPKIVREFAEVIAPLVAENREVQAALEKIVPLPLGVPAATAEAKVAVTPAAKPVAEVEAKQVVTPESKPVVAQVTPKIVREFAEVIAPLVAENREVQAALEKIVPLPLEIPASAPKTETAVMPKAKSTSVVKGKVSEVELPDAGVVMQAAPVASPRQIDASVRPESARVAVDGVSSAVASQRTLPTPSEVLIAAAEAVADTIMVTPGLLTGEGQIRVQLRPDVLEGTEIQLNVTGKAIAVEFLPQTSDMAALIQRCLPQLEQHLAARIHSFTIAATVGTVRRRKA